MLSSWMLTLTASGSETRVQMARSPPPSLTPPFSCLVRSPPPSLACMRYRQDLAGGAWLSASHTVAECLGSRCEHEYSCEHSSLTGHAPDVLSTSSPAEAERWSRLPRLSTLSVRVASTLGYTEPQFEVGEASSAAVDGVRLIACEWSRPNGAAPTPSLIVFAHAPDSAAGRRVLEAHEGVCGGLPIELRTFDSEEALLLAFIAFVVSEADPDILLTYDARCLGLVASRYAELVAKTSGKPKATAKAKAKAAASPARASGSGGGVVAPFNLSRDAAETTKVTSSITYGKAWVLTYLLTYILTYLLTYLLT